MSKESNISREQVEAMVMEHNATYPNNQLGLVNTSELIDISNLCICTYNDNEVDIFTKKYFKTNVTIMCFENSYWADIIYTSYNGNHMAIKSLHNGRHPANRFFYVGEATEWDKKTYLATCKLESEMSFDDMRQKMKDIGEISDFIPGKATRDEINAVLCFAKKYYAPKINVKNLYVCTWGENQIGLFTQYAPRNKDYADNIYTGYNTNHTGIFTINDCNRGGNINTWQPIGYKTTWDSKLYSVSCNMNGAISFDSLREMMRKDKKINSYTPGEATKEEISAVFSWASDHYTGVKQQIEANQPQKVENPQFIKTTDVRNLYICTYDDSQIGLFTKEIIKGRIPFSYRAIELYKGYKSNHTAIFTINGEKTDDIINKWESRGYRSSWYEGTNFFKSTRITYLVTCDMTGSISFDSMRQIMYEAGELSSFSYGVATDEEINAVLSYAKKYFEPNNPKERKRRPQQ